MVAPDLPPKPVVSRLATMKRLQPTILSFIDTLDEKMTKMETALKKEDMSELAGLAHWLKGAGGTVGYDDFTRPAAALESCARSGHVETAAETLKEVQSLAGAVVPPDVDARPG
jgi:HPt (histidine-containing phosphotransfer) domain-containing protein